MTPHSGTSPLIVGYHQIISYLDIVNAVFVQNIHYNADNGDDNDHVVLCTWQHQQWWWWWQRCQIIQMGDFYASATSSFPSFSDRTNLRCHMKLLRNLVMKMMMVMMMMVMIMMVMITMMLKMMMMQLRMPHEALTHYAACCLWSWLELVVM